MGRIETALAIREDVAMHRRGRRLSFPANPTRTCPECGQVGNGLWCYHWDAVGERKIPTRPVTFPRPARHGTE